MNILTRRHPKTPLRPYGAIFVVTAAMGLSACAPASTAASAAHVPDSPKATRPALSRAGTMVSPPEPGQEIFAVPDQAAEALVAATRANNRRKLIAIFGADGARLIDSGDPVADRKARARFVAAYGHAHQIDIEGEARATLIVGHRQWPFPIPLVRYASAWHFDTPAGEQEILDRRIGRNERHVIKVCRIYVEAQEEYADHHRMGGRHEYARRFVSRPGRHDGLYWPVTAGEPESPLGPLVAEARAEGYVRGKHTPYHGYYYRILKAQGKDAPGGARNYVSNGHMTGGFALVAFPAKYGDSGVMTFIVNQDGIVYQKDLGPDSATLARAMMGFDPDRSWNIVP